MKIDFDFQPIDLITDEPIRDADSGKPVTLATIAVQALMMQTADDKDQSADEKINAYVLGARIKGGGEVDITAEDAALLKKRIGKLYGPLIVGQCLPVLDGRPTPRMALVNSAVKETVNG